MDFELFVDDANIELKKARGESTGRMLLSFSADIGEVLEHLDSNEIVNNYDQDLLIEAIGKKAVMDFWNLVEE